MAAAGYVLWEISSFECGTHNLVEQQKVARLGRLLGPFYLLHLGHSRCLRLKTLHLELVHCSLAERVKGLKNNQSLVWLTSVWFVSCLGQILMISF